MQVLPAIPLAEVLSSTRSRDPWLPIVEHDPVFLQLLERKTYAFVCRHLRRHGCKRWMLRQEAAEVSQDALLRLLTHAAARGSGAADDRTPETMLRAIVCNVWRERRRRHEREAQRQDPQAAAELVRLSDDSPWAIEEKIEADRLQEAVFTALEKDLKEPCRQLLDLAYFDDWSCHEISIQLRESLATVYQRLSRCRDFLAKVARIRYRRAEHAAGPR